MRLEERWIWLPKEKYPNNQFTNYNVFAPHTDGNYTVAEFKRSYELDSIPVSVKLRFSGDTHFRLFCNQQLVGTGPASVGGDFIGNGVPRKNFYSFEAEIYPTVSYLDFFAEVQMMPLQMFEYSKGHGGFMLHATVNFSDGRQTVLQTDSSWLTRKNGAYTVQNFFDGRIAPDGFVPAEEIENIWNTETAPIPVREEKEIFADNSEILLEPYEERGILLEFDRIFAAFLRVRAECRGEVELQVTARETDVDTAPVNIVFGGDGEFRDFLIHSVGNLKATVKNHSNERAKITLSIISTHYPVLEEAETRTSDKRLDLVLDVCKHTLKVCRQTLHLDSPLHCEPMACTGDYYIESLMTPFSFGDMRLAEFDVMRTALLLEKEQGRMFHTTYSLIWVRMLHDVYMLSGNKELLRRCEKALGLLLDRFDTYIGENGLIDNPPDYMFIDWIYIDGFTMHHPPKALGQSCLNMYYFGALDAAEKIYRFLGRDDQAENVVGKREALRLSVNSLLFDSDRGIYFEGLNTPESEDRISWALPQNTEKRYYLKHSNVLAAFFGICDDGLARELIRKVMKDEIEGDIQPYFTHFLFEAVFRLGLRDSFTLEIAERWKKPTADCPKGLVEGFVAPEPTYSFDHSHAWGGTPLYSVPKALIGLDILEPGMKKIALSPSLLGLSCANVELLTPYGKLSVEQSQDAEPKITCPEEITVILR